MREPAEFTFCLSEKWFIKINENGIEFNKKDFEHFLVEDFAREFVKIIDQGYKEKFSASEVNAPLTNPLESLDLGEGPLTLRILCCECNAEFELNNSAVALAVALSTTFLEYLSYVQASTCPSCSVDASQKPHLGKSEEE